MGNDEEMDVDDTPLAVWQRCLHDAGQAERQDSWPPLCENAGGRTADLGEENAANGREML